MSEIGGDLSTIVVRAGSDLTREAAKMTNESVKQLLLYLIQKAKEQSDKAGEASLRRLIKSNEEIKMFDLDQSQLKAFDQLVKKYEVTYAVVEDQNRFSVLYKQSEESRIKLILERLLEQELGSEEHQVDVPDIDDKGHELKQTLNEIRQDEERKERGRNSTVSGTVIEHGHAPYEHDEKNENSYYVKLSTDQGERTIWGVDLERAVNEEGVKSGDQVSIENKGKQPVTVIKKERDDEGNVIGEKEIETHRNVWEVRRTLNERLQEIKPLVEAQKQAPPVKIKDKERAGR